VEARKRRLAGSQQDITGSRKKYTGRRINKILGTDGGFWEEESFDHLGRSARSLEAIRHSIRDNPKYWWRGGSGDYSDPMLGDDCEPGLRLTLMGRMPAPPGGPPLLITSGIQGTQDQHPSGPHTKFPAAEASSNQSANGCQNRPGFTQPLVDVLPVDMLEARCDLHRAKPL
jgi:hypothetical protein